ncbi:unnamed protein product [Mytilus coruscus]|uniref:VWFD domain-containing protein n=1 Tax=Mytilus coruscus TaxID=42192 RepID=A0A6J8C142_MYTCO|nr:unnamed protein product [Mytilus coruscus]
MSFIFSSNAIKRTCIINLLNGIPQYQIDKDKCKNGIKDDGLKFTSQYCGIHFNHLDWKTKKYIEVWGISDGIINDGVRLSVLRLYNPDNLKPSKSLQYWKNIHLPDIKVLVTDGDVATRGTACYSHNDPHMRTFDKKYINAYYKKCYSNILCNCGVAARSGNSLFVANFCETIYESRKRVNRYVINRHCDDQNLIVTESGSSYTVILPTGTKITFSHGRISNFYGINGINIIPSVLDKGFTTGLCGKYNGDIKDDLTPRNSVLPADVKTFAESWQVKGPTHDDTLFNPDGKLKDPVYHGQQYCNCKVPNDVYPHGEAIFTCDWTKATETCRQATTKSSVFTASCTNKALRNKRGASLNDQLKREKRGSDLIEDDEKPPMFIMTEEQGDQGIASGSDTWLRATIDNFANACKQEALRTEIFSKTNSTNSTGSEKSILSIIEETTCPGNCSGNGICSEGECHCSTSYSGDDCSTDNNKPPLLETDAFEGECDSSKKACRKFIIPGYDFARNSLACKFVPFSVKRKANTTIITKGESFINSGTYKSSFFMLCELPATRSKRSVDFAIVATGFHISISNNGKDFTDQLSMLVYDSLCYSCNSTTFECKELITCPKKAGNVEEKKNVALYIGIAIGGVAGGVILAIVVIKMIKQLTKSFNLCDSNLDEGWYKITSCAGEKMPTQCTSDGFKCGTTFPIWLSNKNTNGESIYPANKQTVNRTCCMASYDGDCCIDEIQIMIKNCGCYYVYYLRPPLKCISAYCFGHRQAECDSHLNESNDTEDDNSDEDKSETEDPVQISQSILQPIPNGSK